MVPEGVDVFQVLDRRQWILSSRLGFVLERDQLFALGKRSDGPWNEISCNLFINLYISEVSDVPPAFTCEFPALKACSLS